MATSAQIRQQLVDALALDLIGRGISTEQAKERLRETFPGVDADAVLRAVGATPDA